MLWLPYHAFTLLLRSSAAGTSPLADTGLLLLLLLACHSPAAGQLPPNAFRAALQSLQVPAAPHPSADCEAALSPLPGMVPHACLQRSSPVPGLCSSGRGGCGRRIVQRGRWQPWWPVG